MHRGEDCPNGWRLRWNARAEMRRYQHLMVNQRVVKRRSVGVFGSTADTHIQPLDDGGGYYLKQNRENLPDTA